MTLTYNFSKSNDLAAALVAAAAFSYSLAKVPSVTIQTLAGCFAAGLGAALGILGITGVTYTA